MPAATKLTEAELTSRLAALDGWERHDGKLHREFAFPDFIAAWGFMSRVALLAQSRDHHPEWFNVYGTVRIDLNTHSAGGITALDTELAQKINALLAEG